MLIAAFTASGAGAAEYNGICEVSAGVFIDANHFAVASDETNKLQIYKRGKPRPIGKGIDMEPFTSFDKSDLEAAAVIGDRVYWMSSHSFNSEGEDKSKRKVFFATKIVRANGKPKLESVGKPVKSLRDSLAKAAGVEPKEINIEALAATPEGGLLIGLRAPLRNGNALVIPFRNPGAVVKNPDTPPRFGEAIEVKLGNRGLRSMETLGGRTPGYAIVAGPVSDSANGFALFRWPGPGTDPVEVKGADLTGIRPEVAMSVPGRNLLQLLSDDGEICSDEKGPASKRRFRSVDVKP